MGKLTEEEKRRKQQEKDEMYAEQAMLEDIVKIYFKDMRELGREPLTADREKELARRIKQGDIDARNELIESNLPLVVELAQRYKTYGLPFLDVIQAGNEGLILAAENYDPGKKKARFSTYATYWIRKMILLSLDNKRNIHIPDHVLRLLRMLKEVREQLSDGEQNNPSVLMITEALKKKVEIRQVSEETDMSEKEVTKKIKITEETVEDLLMIERMQPDSLERPISEEEEITLGDSIVNADKSNTEEEAISNLDQALIFDMIEPVKNLFFVDEKIQELYKLYLNGASTTMLNRFAEKYSLDGNSLEKLHDEMVTEVRKALEIEANNTVEKVDYQSLGKDEVFLKRLPSGETTQLMQMQDAYAKIFAGFEGAEFEEYDQCWDMYVSDKKTGIKSFSKEGVFLDEIKKIQSVEYEKYVIRYLLDHYHLEMDFENRAACIVNLSECLKNEYLECGFTETTWKKDWNNYFLGLLNNLNENSLGELALATRMDIQIYLAFRKKVLKCKDYDYLNKKFIWMYFTLKYAPECGQLNYKKAYEILKKLYDDKKVAAKSMQNDFAVKLDSSQAVGKKLFLDMETIDGLKPEYRELLFTKEIDKLTGLFQTILNLKKQEVIRSEETVFHEQWKELMVNVTLFEHAWLMEHVKAVWQGEEYKIKKSDMYRFLYAGSNGKKAEQQRCFFESDVFNATFIEDNTFSQFSKKPGYVKRNLLLTLIFLNITYYLEKKEKGNPMEYFERLSLFEHKVWDILSPCGYMMLHSENAYDAFLKLLLSCSEPRALFRYVWKNKEKLIEKCIGEKENASR